MPHPFPKAYLTPSGKVYRPFLELAKKPHLLIAGATGSQVGDILFLYCIIKERT